MNTILIVLGAAALMLLAERLAPGRTLPKVSGWWMRVVAVNSVQAGIVLVAGLTWDRWMPQHARWSADELGLVPGALLGYFAITFIYYWWHRARHEVGFLWRWLHQFHHSPSRIEVVTSFYKHPLEITLNSLLSSAILYLLVGLPPEAAALTVLMTGLAELFYHWNVRTPYWLGFIFQRPESHCVHHQRGRHCYNYSDLPLWDMLLGTFHNPREFKADCGLGEDRERRVGDLLRGRDLTRAELS